MVLPLETGWRRRRFESRPVDPEPMDAHRPETRNPDTNDDAAWLSVGPFGNVDVRPTGGAM